MSASAVSKENILSGTARDETELLKPRLSAAGSPAVARETASQSCGPSTHLSGVVRAEGPSRSLRLTLVAASSPGI
jgi:hypothetical protein